MDQRITVNIAERDYTLMARSPEHEELIRLAATEINKKLAGFLSRYPGRSMVDILSFVALNECIGSLALSRQLEAAKAEGQSLKADTDAYLENIEKTAVTSL